LTRGGMWSVSVALSQPGFLSATYYSSFGFVSPMAAAPVTMNSKLPLPAGPKCMRMSGYIRPIEFYSSVSFKWFGDYTYYPSLHIDSPLVVERPANYTKSPNVSAVIKAPLTVGSLHTVTVDAPYFHPDFAPSLLWSFENVSWSAVPSQRLFTREDVKRFSVHVLSATTCATKSHVTGAGITIATCGVPVTFSIVARDEYSNVQGSIRDRWIVRATLNNATVSRGMLSASGGITSTLAGLDKSGRHIISSRVLFYSALCRLMP
jgi:hypothetical protein